MSFSGKNPKVNWLNLVPLNADPSNPEEGDIFYSDGTPRTEGPWVYQNGAWAQFSTGAAITVVDDLTLTPQSADPGTPVQGMLFSSDGTSRAAGLWYYNGTGWVQLTGVRSQEFAYKTRFTVRAASTANVVLANQVENGDSFGGVTLVTGDLVLLKNQTTASENGVYVVQVSGAPVRSTSYDSASELTYARVFVSSGTNANNTYFQTAVLTSLSDSQVWSTTPQSYSFTVPAGVYQLQAKGCSGGGAGSRSGTDNSGGAAGGGGGGLIFDSHIDVMPGTVLAINLGLGGLANGGDGGDTTITGTGVSITIPGGTGGGAGGNASTAGFDGASIPEAGLGGSGGAASGGSGGGGGGGASGVNGGAGGSTGGATRGNGGSFFSGGGGGGGSGRLSGTGAAGGGTIYAAGGSGGGSQGGGGGGASLSAGANGGAANANGSSADPDGYGGGGGGGGIRSAGVTTSGGNGSPGYLKLSW